MQLEAMDGNNKRARWMVGAALTAVVVVVVTTVLILGGRNVGGAPATARVWAAVASFRQGGIYMSFFLSFFRHGFVSRFLVEMRKRVAAPSFLKLYFLRYQIFVVSC